MFRSHGEKYYSLYRKGVETNKTYARIHKGLYDFIRENEAMHESPALLLNRMKEKFPEFERVQLEYVMFRYTNQSKRN